MRRHLPPLLIGALLGVALTFAARSSAAPRISQPAAGGSATPGGSTTQVQYNNAGAFGGITNLTSDGTNPLHTKLTSGPSDPSAGFVVTYFGGNPVTTSAPSFFHWRDPAQGFTSSFYPMDRVGDGWWGCVQPVGYSSSGISTTGAMTTGSVTGTAASVGWANTDIRQRHRWVSYASSTTASSSAGYRAQQDQVWRGNAAGLGGWASWGTFAIITTTTNQRLFVGWRDSQTVIGTTANPSAQLNSVYFGCDAGQTTIRVCSNDGTGAATCTDLGASYPCTTANATYSWWIWAAPNAASIGYALARHDTAASTSGTISTDLPTNTLGLGWDFWINNGGTAAASTIHFGGICYVANP